MGLLGEIAKGVAEELMPNTSAMVKEISNAVGSSGKKEKKEDNRNRN